MLWLALGLLATGTVSARGEMIDAGKVLSHVRVYDADVTYPPPSWIDGQVDSENYLGLSEFFRDQKGNQFLLEQIPKGETFETWSRLYAVAGLHIDRSGGGLPLSAFVRASLEPFAQACGADAMKIEVKGQSQSSMTLVIYCPAIAGGVPVPNYAEGMAEIGLFRFMAYQNTFLKVYQEWRGKPFSVDDKSSWPVTQAELDLMLARFETIQVAPSTAR